MNQMINGVIIILIFIIPPNMIRKNRNKVPKYEKNDIIRSM